MATDNLTNAFDGVRLLILEASANREFNKLTREEKKAVRIAYNSIVEWFLKKHTINFGD